MIRVCNKVFGPMRTSMSKVELTVDWAFELLEKLPKSTRLQLVYGAPNSLDRNGINPQEAIDLLTPIFRGKPSEQPVEVRYRGYRASKGKKDSLHFIDFVLNPRSWCNGYPIFEARKPFCKVSVLYDEDLNN